MGRWRGIKNLVKIKKVPFFFLLVSGYLSTTNALDSQEIKNVMTNYQFSRLHFLNPLILDNSKLNQLYQLRNYQSYWVNERGQLTSFSVSLKNFFQQSNVYGLNSKDYWSAEIQHLEEKLKNGNRQVAISFELAMTDAVLRFVQDVSFGRLPIHILEQEYKIPSRQFNDYQGLVRALNTQQVLEFESYLRSVSPQIHLYQNLIAALARLRQLQSQNVWAPIYPQTTLKLGVKDQVIPKIRQRLNSLGYQVALSSNEFDYDLLNAVKEFQKLNGLQSDGVIGANGSTIRTLNVPIERRIDQVEQSLDKLRSLPKNLEQRFVLINTAFAELKNYENLRVNMQFKTVVGRSFRRSPSKRDMLEEVIINPTWTVPYKIFKRDKLEHIQSDLSYLTENKIRLIDPRKNQEVDPTTIDWDNVDPDRFPYLLVQNPGLHNALGTIKFPLYRHNDDIYLHDTNERFLFDETVIDRHKSSGCIRLEKPHEFAEYLLRANTDRQWSADLLRSLVPPLTDQEFIETEKIRVKSPMPVYVVYMTAEATDQGQIRFFDDIYGQDARMRQILQAANMGGQ